MSGADTKRYKLRQFVESLPGKRGIDIPEEHYDRIFNIARGITEPLWGRPPTPHQMQQLYDQRRMDQASIQDFYNDLPHPHSSNLRVGEYAGFERAHRVFTQHH